MAMLDHDIMLPHPEFVADAVASLQRDPFQAFIQYPQRFYDINGSDLLYAGNEIFFDGVQVNRNHVGLTAFAGSNAVWNLQSLYHVGGFQYGSLTEDSNTGLAVNAAGYKSSYSLREMAVGQSPQTVKDAMQQRMRWSQGATEMLLHHTKCILTCKSLFDKVALPADLSKHFSAEPPNPPGLGRRLLMCILFFDSMIYPMYSMGFLLHALVCLMYLFNTEAPMATSNPREVLSYWLPLYILKASCQVLAFHGVSLSTQWNSQMAWAGYSLSTLKSISNAVCSGSGWFNTGAGMKDRFWLQYGNTAIALAIYLMIIFRAIAFIAIDNTCTPWRTAGSLLAGLVMLAHIRAWAIEPFRRNPTGDGESVLMLRDLSKQDSSVSSKLQETAMRQSHRNRDDHQSLDLSVLFIYLHVVLLSFLLFFWAAGICVVEAPLAGRTSPTIADTVANDSYCNFNGCNGLTEGGRFCNDGQENCIDVCGGVWCDGNSGYCNFNGCNGLSQGGPSCNDGRENCIHECGGEWCNKRFATTTRYWDCQGGACGCGFIPSEVNATEPIHCYSNAFFEAPEDNVYGASFYGAAAISQTLGGGEWLAEACGKCWKLVGSSNIPGMMVFSSTIVVKGTNYCPPINPACDGKDHFDIAVPGFDFLNSSFANACEILQPGGGLSACENWPNEDCDCAALENPVLRKGCSLFLTLSWDNPTVEYEEVSCPPELVQLPCWEENGEQWLSPGPELCLDPFA